ncbi:MAG: hypothetical protein IJ736_01505 [Firmicutes bacterium]|nr:hypothetical protein [Bacillota bacterium]
MLGIDFSAIDFTLTPGQVIFALVFGYILTVIINQIMRIADMFRIASTEFSYNSENISAITKRCYSLFPQEILDFNGTRYKRGMRVRITTFQNKTFEGEFIGSNKDRDMLCIITKNHIVAHEIQNIETMQISEM